MTLGPLEYLVVGFEGDHFPGQILPELRAVCEKGIIRLDDLLFIKKDASGNTTVLEVSDLSEKEAAQYVPLVGDILGLLTPEDVEQVASQIPNNSSAAIALIEHTWAIGLKEAMRNAGGVPLAGGLVAPAVVQMLEAELAAPGNKAGVKAL